MHLTRITVIALTLVCAACTGSQTGSTTPTATTTPTGSPAAGALDPKASFRLTLDGVVTLPAYASDASASLSTCEPTSAGGWTYLYAGGNPFLSLDLSVYPGAAEGQAPSDFDLDIGAPTGQVRLVPSGRREGPKGTGTARLEKDGDLITITIDGSARTMVDGGNVGDTTVELMVTCPR